MSGGIDINARKKKGYVWLFCFCAGLVAGTLFANYGLGAARLKDSFVQVYIEQIQQVQIDSFKLFIYLCVCRLILAACLAAIACLFRIPFIFYIVTAFIGAAFGYMISAVTAVYGAYSAGVTISMLFPQYLVYVPVYIFLIKLSDIRREQDMYSYGDLKAAKNYAIAAAVVFMLVIAGCALESYVNPVIVKGFVKNF